MSGDSGEDRDALLRALVEHLTEPVTVIAPDGHYLEVNEAYCKALGLPRAQVLGRSVRDFVSAEVADAFRAADDVVLETGRTTELEVWASTMLRREPVLVHSTKSLVRRSDGSAVGILSVLRDVTAERTARLVSRTERELALTLASKSSMHELLEAILDLAVQLPGLEAGGVYARQPDGGFELVHHRELSRAFIETVKSVPAQSAQAAIIGRGKVVVSFDAPERFLVEPRIVATSHGAAEGLRCAVVVPVQVDGVTQACLNLAGRHVDRLSPLILAALETQQMHFGHALKRLDAERRAALERTNFVNAFDAIKDLVFVIDHSGLIVHHNRAVTHALEASFVGRPVSDVHPPEALAEVQQVLADVVQGRRATCTVPFRKSNGIIFPVETSAVLGEWNGKPAIIGISRDVTQQQQAEAALVKARHDADALSAAKSEFLANMSHEVRTPMNAIIGLTQLALDSPVSPEQREYVEQAHGAAVSLLGILNDVLDFSKLEAHTLELEATPFLLSHVLERVKNVGESQAQQRGLSFEVVGSDVASGLRGDPSRLAQVLMNLIGNAIKFSLRGTVRLTVARVNDALVRFEVSDEGEGVNPKQLAAIFQPFTQADGSLSRRHGGTGLGLSISRELVALMGGTLKVESTPGAGSRFSFEARLERCEPPHRATAPVSAALQGLRVLLVEDNAVNQLLGMRLLEKSGVLATLAKDGAECLEVLEQSPTGFDLVLMDLQMPVLDGLSATRRLRADRRFDTLPIIALTAHAFADDRRRCLEAGMQDYVSKPLDPERLSRAIETWRRG
ncbi:MAG: ATP-binding protein [Myxococcaceae bacterium]